MQTYTCLVVTRDNAPALAVAAMEGNLDFERAIRMVGRWLGETDKRAPDRTFLCFDCETEFNHGQLPESFLVAFPTFASGEGVVTGVCAECCRRADLTAMCAAWARKLWPDAQVKPHGTA